VGVISANKVREYIVPYLSVGKRGFTSKLCLTKVMLPGQTHKYFKEYMPTIAVATFLCYGKT
jgi:hypothetical protein